MAAGDSILVQRTEVDEALASDVGHGSARERFGGGGGCLCGGGQSREGKGAEDDLLDSGHWPIFRFGFSGCRIQNGSTCSAFWRRRLVNTPSAPVTAVGADRRKEKSGFAEVLSPGSTVARTQTQQFPGGSGWGDAEGRSGEPQFAPAGGVRIDLSPTGRVVTSCRRADRSSGQRARSPSARARSVVARAANAGDAHERAAAIGPSTSRRSPPAPAVPLLRSLRSI